MLGVEKRMITFSVNKGVIQAVRIESLNKCFVEMMQEEISFKVETNTKKGSTIELAA